MVGYLYIIYSELAGKYYIGSTIDLDRRMAEHNSGKNIATKNKGKWELKFFQIYNDIKQARCIEYKIKKLKRRDIIEDIIENKIILEVKCTRFLGREEYYQTQRYIHAFNIQLGIMVNFRDERINPRRILNSEYKNSSISVIL